MARLTTVPPPDDEAVSVWDQLDDYGRKALVIGLVCALLVGALLSLRVRASITIHRRTEDFRIDGRAQHIASETLAAHLLAHHRVPA